MKEHIKSLLAKVDLAVVYLTLMYTMHFLFALIQVLLYKTLVGVDGLLYVLVLWNSYWFTAVFVVLLHHHKTGDSDSTLYVRVMKHWWFVSSIEWLYLFVLKELYPLIEVLLFGEEK